MEKQQVHQALAYLTERWIGQAEQANEEGVEMAGLVLAVLMNLVWVSKFPREQADELSSRLRELKERHEDILSEVWGERGDKIAKALESLR